jgi:hypothetical protein
MRISQLNSGNALSFANLIPGSAMLPIEQGGITYPITAQDLLQAGQLFIDVHAYGAKGDAVGNHDGVVTGGTTFSAASYQFPASRVGQTIYVNGSARVITSVSNGVATLSSSVTNGTGIPWLVGTDDTNAIEAAMQAARTVGAAVGDGSTSETNSWGPIPFGGTVMLRSGRGYLVKNTQARFDAGKTAAIVVPRRCALRGGGMGQTHIILAPGNVGHGVTNENSQISGGSWSDFLQAQDFSVFCNGGWQSSSCLSGVYVKVAFNNYVKTDAFPYMANIRVFEAKQDAFYISGRGEGVYFNLFAGNAFRYGFFIDGSMDSRFFVCNSGGAFKTGFRVNKSANIHLTNCKSYYSGATGGSSNADCANFALLADSFVNGLVYLTNCEAQESRGSGFYIESGMNLLNGCISSDPGRAALVATGTPPTVRAGYHLKDANSAHQNPKYNRFNSCIAQPTLTFDYNDLSNTASCGTNALYIEGTANKGNIGDIYTFPQATYSDSKVAGTGTTSGQNTGLRVDGVALT